jgi:predicted nucleic acid-binding protein
MSIGSGKSDDRVYFDSCIYIAHYRQEIGPYGAVRINAIGELWKENERGGTTILTSSITVCEVIDQLLKSNLKAEINDFKNRFRMGLHKMYDVDPIIAERAAEYRDFYRKHPVKTEQREKPYINLASPDAIHLATAIHYEADEFWTFDGLNDKADKYESIKPLWLGNKVGNDVITIIPPSLPQGALPLLEPDKPN